MQQNRRSNPPRSEGLLDQPNARREYDVLSFLVTPALPVKLPTDKPVELRVRFCPPATGIAPSPQKTAFIEVRQMAGHVNYLMKATQQEKDQHSGVEVADFTWPSADVIWPARIDPNRLGVVVHWGQDNEYGEEIVPAYFGTTAAAPNGPAEHYQLTLRIQQKSVEDLSYEINPANGPLIRCYYQSEFKSCGRTKPEPPMLIEAGSLVRLDLDLSNVAPGPVTVTVSGKYHDQDERLEANFHFEHNPLCH